MFKRNLKPWPKIASMRTINCFTQMHDSCGFDETWRRQSKQTESHKSLIDN